MERGFIVDHSRIEAETFTDSLKGSVSWKSLVNGDHTNSNRLTCGMATLPPVSQHGHLALHRHEPAEIYYLIAGEAEMHLDGKVQQVYPGNTIYIPENMEHGIFNVSETPVIFLYVFAADRFSDIKYVFS